jgi:hypothetical protein
MIDRIWYLFNLWHITYELGLAAKITDIYRLHLFGTCENH